MLKTSGRYFGRLSNLFQSNSNLNLKLARSTLALHFFLSLSSVSFFGKPTKSREGDLLGISLWMSRDLKNPFLLVFFAWHRGKKGSPRPPCQNLSLSLCYFDHHCRHRPPMVVRRPCRNPSWPRDTETDPAHPTPPRTSPRHHHGCLARSARHRPPPALSPRCQACLDPTGRFPEADSLERDRARRPGHVDVNQSGRPARLERVCRSRASVPRPASLCTRTCTASSPRCHTTLARHRDAPTPPHGTPFRPQLL
jgi:hypothetical protein